MVVFTLFRHKEDILWFSDDYSTMAAIKPKGHQGLGGVAREYREMYLRLFLYRVEVPWHYTLIMEY